MSTIMMEYDLMNGKNTDKTEIHIVFKVLNFLKSKHHAALITSKFEHLLLIILSSHKGEKGIFPSIPTLADELHCSDRYVNKGLNKWESLEIIEIEKNDGKTNHYFLHIPEPTPEQEFTPDTSVTPEQEFTPPLNYSSVTPEQEFPIYNKVITKEVTKKSSYMHNNSQKNNEQKINNEKRHDFADSKDQMANEKRHIEEHEKRKKEECNGKRFCDDEEQRDRNRIQSRKIMESLKGSAH